MAGSPPVGCARCGTILDPHFRFCPECALPVSGEGPMSTEIADLRRRVESASGDRRGPAWGRYLVPVVAASMFTFVFVLGIVLFNRPILNQILPPPDRTATAGELPHPPRWEPEWVVMPPGVFPLGDEGDRGEIKYPFLMSKYEVPNDLWFDFLVAERSRLVDSSLWQEAFPKLVDGWSVDARGSPVLDHTRDMYPVANVSPVAAAAFCAWLTARLGDRNFEIRLPTQMEWEYAARGTEGRTYSWGNEDVEIQKRGVGGGGRNRTGIDSAPLRVNDSQLAADDTSPFGIVAMGTNVSEWTVKPDPWGQPDQAKREFLEDLTVDRLRRRIEERQLGVHWRGASWSYDAAQARRAKAWNSIQSEGRDCRPDVGIRLVKVKVSK